MLADRIVVGFRNGAAFARDDNRQTAFVGDGFEQVIGSLRCRFDAFHSITKNSNFGTSKAPREFGKFALTAK